MAQLSLSSESISTLSSEISSYLEGPPRSRGPSFGTSYSEDEEHDNFHNDASTSIYDSLRDGVSSDVVQLELVSLRMSTNASDHQVRRAIVSSFMRRIQQLVESGKGAGEAIKDVFTRYRDVVERSIFDKEKDEKKDQVDLLLQIQQDLVHRNKGEMILLFTAKELYDLELVEEEAYEQWWADERSSSTEEMKKVRSQTKQFVDWLADAEEEEESDEEEDEEGEEEEEEEEESDEE
jgi:translation initiation factor eIF-2B subunit epsilon